MNQNNVMRWRKRRTGGGRGGQMEVWTSPGGGVRVKRHGERDTKTNITFSVVLIYDLMHISIYIYHMPGENNDALVAFTNKQL